MKKRKKIFPFHSPFQKHTPSFSFFISFRRSSSRKQTRNSCFPSTETTRLLVEYSKYTSIIRLSFSLSLSFPLLYQHARTPSISVTSRRACRNLTSVVSLDCFSNALSPSSSNPLLLWEMAVSSWTRHDDERIVYPVVRSITNRAKHGRVKVERRISCYRIVNDVNENHRNRVFVARR